MKRIDYSRHAILCVLVKRSKNRKQVRKKIIMISANEINSWGKFGYALREGNRLLFNKMLSECKKNEGYIRGANSKDEFFSAESLFMVLILQQQKTMNELIAKLLKQKGKEA